MLIRKSLIAALLVAISGVAAVAAVQTASRPASKARIDELIRQLGDPQYAKRQAAQEQLIAIGAPAREALQAAAGDADPERAARAKEILKRIAHFAIYLLADQPRSMRDATAIGRKPLATLDLAADPLWTEGDVVSYQWTDHVMTLTKDAFARQPQAGNWGTYFVVVADGQRCYVGAFMGLGSSFMPSVPVAQPSLGGPASTVTISRGLRSAVAPTEDGRVRAALKAAGKLAPDVAGNPADADKLFLTELAPRLEQAVGGTWQLSDKPGQRGWTLGASFSKPGGMNTWLIVYPGPWTEQSAARWAATSGAVVYGPLASSDRCTLLGTGDYEPFAGKAAAALGLKPLANPREFPTFEPPAGPRVEAIIQALKDAVTAELKAYPEAAKDLAGPAGASGWVFEHDVRSRKGPYEDAGPLPIVVRIQLRAKDEFAAKASGVQMPMPDLDYPNLRLTGWATTHFGAGVPNELKTALQAAYDKALKDLAALDKKAGAASSSGPASASAPSPPAAAK